MAIKHNVKETAIRQYILDRFTDNPLKIPFRMGMVSTDENTEELLAYSLKFNNDGLFDVESKIDLDTYMETQKSVVIIETSGLSGDFVARPDIQSGSFSANIEILVNIDSNVSHLIKSMIKYVRDSFIGRFDVLEVYQRDWEDEDAVEKPEYYTIVSNASSIDFGNPFEINSRRYLIFSFNVDFEVSKDIMYGNQIEWKLGFYENGNLQALQETKPLIASWATSQDTEPMQVLRSKVANNKAKEIHAYVKSRGYSLVFTYLLNLNDPIHKRFYLESYKKLDTPNYYYIQQKTKLLNNKGEFVVDEDFTEERKMVAESFVPDDVIFGEPMVISIGFLPSAK